MNPVDRNVERKLVISAWIVTGAVLFLVALMRRVKIELPAGWDLGFLPPVHAVLNASAAVALVVALLFIKKGRIQAHRRSIYVAMALSILFLLCYVGYHFTTPETVYGDTDGDGEVSEEELSAVGASRTVYLVFLLSHISLAAGSLPFILFTFIRGFLGDYERHRRMARWVFPIWLYVALTGPLCYLMLRPYY